MGSRQGGWGPDNRGSLIGVGFYFEAEGEYCETDWAAK